MKNNIQNKLYWVYLGGIFLILTLPLLSAPPLFHPAPWGKSIVFRIIFSILLFIFLGEILFSNFSFTNLLKTKINKNILFPSFLLAFFFFLLLLATIFSLDSHFSFWGSPYRGGGFLTLGLIIIFSIFLFLIVRDKDWQKIIDFSLGVGMITGIIAIFQKIGAFSNFMVSYKWRPVATLGGPIFFALYLILLIFLSLSFGISAKGKKKIFYFLAFVFLFIGLILSGTRSALLGFGIGLLFFIFFFPKISNQKHHRYLLIFKVIIIITAICSIIGVSWLKTQPEIVQKLKTNEIFGSTFDRIWRLLENPIETILTSRISGWKVALKAIKDRPLLGYGPENFSIGFDKFYDPNLPGIVKEPNGGSTSWWDRGHNFIFDIGVSAGIPALITYLLLIAVLFYQLRKIKNATDWRKNQESFNHRIISHGIQTTFIAYLITDFFSFDVFSTYLIFFILIAYTFYLIHSFNREKESNQNLTTNTTSIKQKVEEGFSRYVIIFILFFVLLWFLWSGNIKPLLINKKINQYVFLSENIYSEHYTNSILAKKKEQLLLQKMDELLEDKSVIDNYIRLQYIDIISKATSVIPEKTPELSLKAINILRECQKLRPYYTRSWLYEVIYINKYLESNPHIDEKTKEQLNQEALACIKKAEKLSPHKPDIFIALTANFLINKEYEKAKETAEKCIQIAPNNGQCWWAKSLALIGLKNIPQSIKAMEIAKEKGYQTDTKYALGQLVTLYSQLAKKTGKKEYYQKLAFLYQKLIEVDKKEIKELEEKKGIKRPENFQFHASLAYVYKILGEYEKARKEAEIVLKLSPSSKKAVENFLKSLPPEK